MNSVVDDALKGEDVSRETVKRLQDFVTLVVKWNPAINLVAKSTIPEIWQRHVRDSMQLYPLVQANPKRWLDLGSGSGFPGVVLAILAHQRAPEARFTLVESDQRKAAFLRTACHSLGLNAQVLAARIENLPPQAADVITARALAPLDKLCALAAPHIAAGGICLFPKGGSYAEEVAEARRNWKMDLETFASVTDPEAVILKLKALVHV
ncbi:16S rRNA m(7)G-527 methyltransferase [Cereibacter ovatus]|uniref:Ribosomal RNA small subunit methyltransferase G n=1 Tax=Cereibacter ovatus TaxID=439529 RepID=A0A285CQP5_9RHOB|nr:16S rRNA (guanine(527)-N(7))-methyltransferase RsmG [Cereibacter ovatus]SNX69862.1 16S rRNA m(7)G-527 methyltransferase [Cereibacter ovatus]